jgi:hypothetical protein
MGSRVLGRAGAVLTSTGGGRSDERGADPAGERREHSPAGVDAGHVAGVRGRAEVDGRLLRPHIGEDPHGGLGRGHLRRLQGGGESRRAAAARGTKHSKEKRVSEAGVPASALVGEDHIQVRAALVAYLGGANQAVVFTRIEYRARHVAFAHEHDGAQWWEVKQADLARETGLTVAQVETALANLLKVGAIRAEQHSLPMQTMSYSPVIAQSGDSRIGNRRSPDSNPEIPGLQIGDSRIAPIAEEREEAEEEPIVEADPISAGFERVFKSWPATRRVRKTAAKAWVKAAATVGAEKLERLIWVTEQHGTRYRTWATSEQTFVPHLTTWLNQERWTMPLPEASRGQKQSTVEHGRNVDQILRDREAAAVDERKAVSA